MTLLRLTAIAAALATSLAAATPASAQSLRELYEAARAYDATYLAARAQADSAQYRALQADALSLPSASLTGAATAGRVDPPRFDADGTITTQAQLTGRYPLWNKSNQASQAQAKKALEISQAELDVAEQDLIVRVAQAYFDVLASQDSLGTTRASKAATAEQLASAKRNFEVGTATITDTREAQARFDLDVAREIAAENELRTRRIALDQLVGRVGIAPRPLATPVVLPATLPANPEEWVTQADQQHPTVRRARVGLDVATLEIDKARAAESPTLDVVGRLSASHLERSQLSSNGATTNATLGLELSWPLYTGGATGNRIKETLSLEEKARNDLEAARRGVAQGTRVAYFGVQSLGAQVKALEAAESSSKLALEATQLGYKVGVRVNLDVLNAQTQLFQTQRDLAKARYDVLIGGLRLRQASGQLAVGDVEAVNGLLAK